MAIKKAASEEAAQYDSYAVVYLTVFIAFFAFSFKFPRSGLVQLVFAKGFPFSSLDIILLNSFFEHFFASARSLMESFPIICSKLELSQLSLRY